MLGFFGKRAAHYANTPPYEPQQPTNDRKVILLCLDALREDFVEYDADTHTNLDPDSANAYTGKKMKLFRELKEKEPDNTVLLPMWSATPTMTILRTKTALSGALTTFFDTSDEFMPSAVKDDNVLWQLKQTKTKDGREPFVRQIGDAQWGKLYAPYFDKSDLIPIASIRDLDTVDRTAEELIYEEMDSGSNFDIMINHLNGLDNAGHTHGSFHPDI